MRPRAMLVLTVVVLACLLVGTDYYTAREQDDSARRAADRKAIEELHRRDTAATKAFDVETLALLWTNEIVSLPPGQAPLVGRQANRAMLEAARQQSKDVEVLGYEQDWKELTFAGDYAFEWGRFQSAFRVQGKKPVRQTHNVLRILRRHPDGSWKVHRTIWNVATPTPQGQSGP